MLKKIPKILTPELMKTLMEMGHGDELVIADGNFPAHSLGKKVIRCDSAMIMPLLEAILEFFPMEYRKEGVILFQVPKELEKEITVQKDYKDLILKSNENVEFNVATREEFYKRASDAYAVVITGDRTRFASLIIRKGVVTD